MFDTSIKNKRKTAFIVAVFVALIATISYFICIWLDIDSYFVIPISMGVAIFSSVVTYYNSDKIILSMSNARPATKEQNQKIVENLEGLCIAAGLPMPKLYIINDSAPNAFATGRDPQNSVICVTTGILEKLDDYELEGVLAHELSHIKNYDILLQTVAIVMVGFISIIADLFMRVSFRRNRSNNRNSDNSNAIIMLIGLVFIILSPIAAELLKLALSRNREYLADSSAIELTRNPQGLINALIKISSDNEPLEVANKTTASLFICNPFKGKDAQTFLNKLYSTHPPITDRINALKNIS